MDEGGESNSAYRRRDLNTAKKKKKMLEQSKFSNNNCHRLAGSSTAEYVWLRVPTRFCYLFVICYTKTNYFVLTTSYDSVLSTKRLVLFLN